MLLKMAEEGTLPGSTLYAMVTMIPKPGKNTTHKKENHRPVSPTNRHKSPQQNTNKSKYIRRIIHDLLA